MTRNWVQIIRCPKCWATERFTVNRLTEPKPALVVCKACRPKPVAAAK